MAVVHNQTLFKALIACLSSNTIDIETESRPLVPLGSRKRAHSLGQEDLLPSKSLKLAHATQVGKRSLSYPRPQLNVRTLAATILFSAFEHFDHWPVPLVKAYAEDCFGPRSWVDEPASQLLVKNLAFAHTGVKNQNVTPLDEAHLEADALLMAEFYRNRDEERFSPSPSKRERETLSSYPSQKSVVGTLQITRPRSMSNGSFDSTSLPPTNTKPGDESDSGDEEEVALKTTVSMKTSEDSASSSSGEEDEQVLIRSKSFDEDNNSESSPFPQHVDGPPVLKPTYPVTQQTLNFKRIRQRYFGINLEHAHSAISSSLNERLDVKSKQNSSLLQSLPAFTSIPEVRTLITSNLEKWLQSPALAGLGRSLFKGTVNMMKNVDPPLPADLAAIGNILSMRLKANQVSIVVPKKRGAMSPRL